MFSWFPVDIKESQFKTTSPTINFDNEIGYEASNLFKQITAIHLSSSKLNVVKHKVCIDVRFMFSGYVQTDMHITTLELADNYLLAEGAKYLVEMLRANFTIQNLVSL